MVPVPVCVLASRGRQLLGGSWQLFRQREKPLKLYICIFIALLSERVKAGCCEGRCF